MSTDATIALTPVYVVAEYEGLIPVYGYRLFRDEVSARNELRAIVAGWGGDHHNGAGDEVDLETCSYVASATGDYEVRLTTEHLPGVHVALADAIRARLPGDPDVYVDPWDPGEDGWTDPVYVSARWSDGREGSGVCDLATDSLTRQATYVAEQIADEAGVEWRRNAPSVDSPPMTD